MYQVIKHLVKDSSEKVVQEFETLDEAQDFLKQLPPLKESKGKYSVSVKE